MGFTISVAYPKRISISSGAQIEIMGYFEGPDEVTAYRIVDSERGQNYQLHPNEIPEVKPYEGPNPWKSPFMATVVSSSQFGEITHLTVFPLDQSVYDYNRTMEPLRRAAVPAFWKLVEQRQQWEHTFSPFGTSLWDIRREQPRVFDASPTVQNLLDLFARKRCFHVTHAVDYLWRSLQKLCQVERHLTRLKIIDDLRRHLFSTSRNEQREYVLSETQEEAGLIVEAATIVAYSALDLLGHVINEVYQLGIGSDVANFMNTVTEKRREDEVETTGRKCLERDFPREPLKIFLMEQRSGWIRDLETWRHYIVHHGVLNTGNFVDGGVVIIPPQFDTGLVQNLRLDSDATTVVSEWATQLRHTLVESFRLVGEKATRMAALSDEELPVGKYSEDLFPIDRSRPMKEILEFLRLWQAHDGREPDRIVWMFSRLHPDWRKEWPIATFRTFIESHPLHGYQFTDSIGSSKNGPTTTTIILNFSDVKVKWGVAMVPYNNKYVLVRRPESTFPALQSRLTMTNLKRGQSSRDTGYRDAVFTGVIKNIGDACLDDVSLHIFSRTFCGATAKIDSIEASEERAFEVIWKDGCVPFGSRNSFPVPSAYATPGLVIRAIYKYVTHEGNFWAEDARI